MTEADELGKSLDALCRAHADACRAGDKKLARALASRIARRCEHDTTTNEPEQQQQTAMTEADELERIEAEIEELGKGIKTRCDRALEILKGWIATTKHKRFRIVRAYAYFGGGGCRLYFTGPVLKQDGTAHARQSETSSLSLMDKIERMP